MGTAVAASGSSLYDFTLTGIDGKPFALSQFEGKVVLLVNTASECGYTGQYEGLEKLYLDYRDKGLVVVGVPSNDFGAQEPGEAAEIASFCKLNYGVTFPLADKTVVSGAAADPLYVWAGEQGGDAGQAQLEFPQVFVRARRGIYRLVLNANKARERQDCCRNRESPCTLRPVQFFS